MKRRDALAWINLGLGTALGAAVVIPVLGPVLHPLRRGQRGRGSVRYVDIGPLTRFAADSATPAVLVDAGRDAWMTLPERPALGVFVLRGEGEAVRVLSRVCPHLGCAIEARPSGFHCPCHGSDFDADGARREGGEAPNPSPRDMDELAHRLIDGRLHVALQRFRPGAPTAEPVA